jgi:dTDP-4-dehydrorhamnose 3,5-epimerase
VIFTATAVAGAWLLDLEPLADERGFFARTFCERELAAHGLDPRVAQCSIAWNPERGTVRGLHYQMPPHGEAKLVRCTRGAIHDVVVDLRPASPTFKRHVAVELSAENRRQLYVPPGCAHGYQTLVADSEVSYQMSEPYAASAGRGVRWDDAAFGVAWPLPVTLISERDRSWPDFSDE